MRGNLRTSGTTALTFQTVPLDWQHKGVDLSSNLLDEIRHTSVATRLTSHLQEGTDKLKKGWLLTTKVTCQPRILPLTIKLITRVTSLPRNSDSTEMRARPKKHWLWLKTNSSSSFTTWAAIESKQGLYHKTKMIKSISGSIKIKKWELEETSVTMRKTTCKPMSSIWVPTLGSFNSVTTNQTVRRNKTECQPVVSKSTSREVNTLSLIRPQVTWRWCSRVPFLWMPRSKARPSSSYRSTRLRCRWAKTGPIRKCLHKSGHSIWSKKRAIKTWHRSKTART